MLRYQIAADQQVLVPLRSELAVAEDYIALMKIQFEERLTLTIKNRPLFTATAKTDLAAVIGKRHQTWH